ncbi:MAG TPA: DPP IV N-terminal domain-containing protein [Bryobacteraceae bacterium]|nr:DPP IV N-terminal domain-containing protein [Bryobacteraceae bacterium]
MQRRSRMVRIPWGRYTVVAAGLAVLLAATLPGIGADNTPASPAPGVTSGMVPASKANYELASQWTPARVGKLVFDVAVTPHWLESGDRFWYSFENTKGRKFYLVDPAKKTRSYVFDPVKLAASLTTATGLPYDSQHLPITVIRFVKNDSTIQFELNVPKDALIPGEKPKAATAATETGAGQQQDQEEEQNDDLEAPQQQGGRGGAGIFAPPPGRDQKQLTFEYELAGGKLTLLDEPPVRKPAWASISPDEKVVVFARNHNLYMMDAANYAKALKDANDKSIVETQLTTDGVEDFGYGGRGMGGGEQQQQQEQQENGNGEEEQNHNRRQSANVSWSRDSKKFALVRRDSRKVKQLWVINALANPRPTLETYRYAMPGDAEIPQASLEIFDVDAKSKVVAKADAFKDQTIQVEVDRPSARSREHQRTEPLWVGPGSDKLYFTRLSRDMHRLDLCTADTATGEVKPVIEERMNVYIESKPVKVIDNGNALVWWSERDGWGHYYLYDSAGTLKNQVDKGEYVAEDISYVDERTRALFMTASGHEDGEDPYFMHFYRANLDGSGMKMLDPGDGSHTVNMSDSGRYAVDTYSRVDTAPASNLIDAQGADVMPLEKVDVAPLLAAGFKFPEPFKVKADDGITDLYGVMYKPFDFDAKKKYPVIEYVYPGPQTESVTKTFTPKSNQVVMANMGFIMLEVGNRGGNPHRSKWYHTFGYHNLRDYGLADKKAAIEQLAERFPFIDATRVGIWGHSGGGFMTAAALLIYPDFFKVGWSESGNHENNIYNNSWSEKHNGVKEVTDKDGKVHFEYSIDKNSEIAQNLKGHLMLVTGDIDNNVHPSNTYRLANALIKANKRFDFMILPGQRHSYGPDAEYVSWRRADYFARYLLGESDQDIDMWELNREKQDKPPAAPAGAGRGTLVTQQGQGRGRGRRSGN